MYEAINDFIICKKQEERKTDSGIYLHHQEDTQTVALEVVATTLKTAHLEGRTVVVESRHSRAKQLPDGQHVSVNVNDIIAVYGTG